MLDGRLFQGGRFGVRAADGPGSRATLTTASSGFWTAGSAHFVGACQPKTNELTTKRTQICHTNPHMIRVA
jgi:hypothetical protein